jgi:hypothetical protein
MVLPLGIEPRIVLYERTVIPFNYRSNGGQCRTRTYIIYLVRIAANLSHQLPMDPSVGIEPTPDGFEDRYASVTPRGVVLLFYQIVFDH